jgi:hypothetical protein
MILCEEEEGATTVQESRMEKREERKSPEPSIRAVAWLRGRNVLMGVT